MAIDYCDQDPLGEADVIACPKNDLVGGFSALVILEDGHTVEDPSSASEINANINTGHAHVVKRCSLAVDAATPVEQESLVPCETPSLLTYDRGGPYINPNVTPNNVSFHDRLFDGRVFPAMIIANCGRDGVIEKVLFIQGRIKLKGSLIAPKNNNEFMRFEGSYAYKSSKNPTLHDAPQGIF